MEVVEGAGDVAMVVVQHHYCCCYCCFCCRYGQYWMRGPWSSQPSMVIVGSWMIWVLVSGHYDVSMLSPLFEYWRFFLRNSFTVTRLNGCRTTGLCNVGTEQSPYEYVGILLFLRGRTVGFLHPFHGVPRPTQSNSGYDLVLFYILRPWPTFYLKLSTCKIQKILRSTVGRWELGARWSINRIIVSSTQREVWVEEFIPYYLQRRRDGRCRQIFVLFEEETIL